MKKALIFLFLFICMQLQGCFELGYLTGEGVKTAKTAAVVGVIAASTGAV